MKIDQNQKGQNGSRLLPGMCFNDLSNKHGVQEHVVDGSGMIGIPLVIADSKRDMLGIDDLILFRITIRIAHYLPRARITMSHLFY